MYASVVEEDAATTGARDVQEGGDAAAGDGADADDDDEQDS